MALRSLLIAGAVPCCVGWSTPMPEPVVSVADAGCIGALEKLRASGGGTMLVPSGVWTCPPMNLTSHLTVYLKEGGTLKADPHADWPLLAPLKIYGTGHDHPGPRWAPFLNGYNVVNLTIGGENGTIDGSGAFWWERKVLGIEKHTRPSLWECVGCQDLVLEDVTFKNSGFWTLHPVLSRRVTARRITVLNPLGSPNTDGFDPDSTSDVILEDSHMAVSDDAVAIKAGWDCAGYAGGGTPSDNITIRNLTVARSGGGISIGSEMSGGVSNVLVEDVSLHHGSYGIFVKTGGDGGYARGGFVENVTIRRVEIVGAIKSAVTLNSFYGSLNPSCGDAPARAPTRVRNITIRDVVSRHALNDSLQLAGLADEPMAGITFANVTFDQTPFQYYCDGGVVGVQDGVTPALPSECGFA